VEAKRSPRIRSCSDRELSKILKDNGQADYVTKFSRGAFGGPGSLDFNISGAGGDWNGSLQDWRQQNPSLLTPAVPTVEIVGSMPTYIEWMANKFKTTPETMAERLGSGNDSLYDFKVSQRSYYRDGEAIAANPVTRELWHVAGLASKAGNNIGAAGYGAYRIATNADAASAAAASLKHTWDNVPRIMARQANVFSSMTLREKSDALITFGLESAASWGLGKAAGATGKLTYNAGVNTLKSLAPTAGAMLENYMYRSGLLMYAVEPGGVRGLGSDGLRGSSKVLADNMGGIPEGYQAHHRALSSLAQESETLQYLAKSGLYDVNRAANGVALPGDEFLALADDLPLHRGFHGAEYRSAVRDGLNRLDAAFQRGASDSSLLRRVETLERSLVDRLLKGELWLNNADAQLRNLGPFGPK
jgi:hypothetical protein